ncbi:MAG: DUF4377 domain-containing protein [Anaerolineales bacterium]|nr:DUF4377 domain-containing protein [Anaerolineales bacterium]
MKTKSLLIFGLLMIFLAACAGNVQPADGAENEVSGIEAENAVNREPSDAGFGPESDMVKVSMLIAPDLVDCEGGAGPQKCMQVKFGNDEDWQFFYTQIEGFEYQPGYRYSLLVKQVEVENPPADGSSLRYVLVEVISQEEALMEESGNLDGRTWKLLSMGSESGQRNIVRGGEATFTYDPETGLVAGTTGCNNYFGPVEIDEETKMLTFGPLGMTRMACRGDLNQQEIDFMSLLESVTHFAVEGDRLVLYTEGEDVLVFEPGD